MVVGARCHGDGPFCHFNGPNRPSVGAPTHYRGYFVTIVASFGGVIRDSLCQDIPMIFKKGSTLYASLAFLGAYLYVGLVKQQFLHLLLPWQCRWPLYLLHDCWPSSFIGGGGFKFLKWPVATINLC